MTWLRNCEKVGHEIAFLEIFLRRESEVKIFAFWSPPPKKTILAFAPKTRFDHVNLIFNF